MGEQVDEIVNQMRMFSWVDYVVFVSMLAVSAFVGVYWGFMNKQITQADYLLGGRNMKVVPVAMSLVASFVSGITLLGLPTEVYMYGTQYAYIVGAIFLMSLIMTHVYLPVFHGLKITSNYEYLSIRFDNRVRLFGSILFAFTLGCCHRLIVKEVVAECIQVRERHRYSSSYCAVYNGYIWLKAISNETILILKRHSSPYIGWLPIVIYVPALAFNQVTGINIYIITPIVCLVCIFYTSAGGLQAVVWTDVIQITAMFGAMILVAIKGTMDVGGFGVVIQRNMDSGRIEAPDWDPNPLTRHTVWNLLVGGVIYWLQANAVNQTMVQRYLALPTLRSAKLAVYLFCIGISALYCFCLYCGLLIYARFYNCDPLKTKLAKAKDQLLPLFVMDVLGDIPGLSGVFIAGVFSAALSSLSTSLNSMSAVVLEDFYKPFCKRELSERQSAWLMRSVVIFLGTLCVALVFIVEKMGTILQLTMTLESMTMGPQLGVFTMGILMPWVDATGALIGGVSGLVIMSWWCLTAQLAIARGDLVHPHKPLTTEGCLYNFTIADNVEGHYEHRYNEEINPILRVSYMWYTLSGAILTMCIGAAVSRIGRARGKPYLPPALELLAPQLRRLYKEPPHPADDPYIRAYGKNKEINHNLKSTTSINMKPITEYEEII